MTTVLTLVWAARRSRRRQCVTFITSYIAYASLYVSRKAFSVVKPVLLQDLTTIEMASIDTSFLSFYAFFQIFLPSLSDRFGTRPILLTSYTVAGLACGLFSCLHTVKWMSMTWAIEGVAHSAVFASFIKTLTPTLSQSRRGVLLGTWTTSQQVGAVASTVLVSSMTSHFGWRAAFALAGGVTLAAGGLIAVTLEESRYVKEEQSEIEMGEATSTKSRRSGTSPPSPLSLWETVKIPNLMLCAISYFCVKLIRYSILFWLPLFLASQLFFSPEASALYSTLFDVGGAFGAVLVGWTADRFFARQRRSVAGVACLCSLVVCMLLASTTAMAYPPGILFSIFILGFVIAAADSILGAGAAVEVLENFKHSEDANETLSTAAGIINGIGAFGGVAQGFTTAGITEKFGWPSLFVFFGFVSIVGAGCLVPSVREENLISTEHSKQKLELSIS